MSDPVPTVGNAGRQKPFRLGAAGVAALAAIGTITLCFAELPGGSALDRVASVAPTEGVLSTRDTPSNPAWRPLLDRSQWFNGRLDSQALRGKVVLVNFWTYSCINSLRPLPYLRAWAQKYRARGLIVVGVHTPEFDFEKDPANVRQALAALEVPYPIVLDSNFKIWRSFGNNGWPGFYLIDADGRVRHQRLGEGDLAQTERAIERLLAEKDGRSPAYLLTPVNGRGIEAAADWANQQSRETYVGYAKAEGFSSPGGLMPDRAHRYAPAAALPIGRWDLANAWNVGREFAETAGSGGILRYRFHARDLHIVMGLASDHKPVRFRLTIDGAAPGADHGVDVDANGWGEVREDRLYQLVRQSDEVRDRTFEMEFSAGGARVYAFTFG